MREEGSFYCVNAHVGGAPTMRVSLMNPATERSDLVVLLQTIRGVARRLLAEPGPHRQGP